jgi:hypothetical protein
MADDRRAAVLHAFRESRMALLSAIQGLSEEQLSDQAIDGWSAKDHLAHVVQMDEIRYFEICRVAHGRKPAWAYETDEESEALNKMGVEHRRYLSLEQILWELDFVRARILMTIENAPEDSLEASRYGEFGLDGGAAHEREHADTIVRWRRESGL